MSDISHKISKGNLLIAAPSILTDPSFNRSVILITQHDDEEGSVGFILNRPTGYVVSDLIAGFDCDFPVYSGGPVERNVLYYLHRVPELLPGSEHVASDIYWGGNYEAVKKMIEKGLISSHDIRFFMGYSGWSPDQLAHELEEDTWVLTENDYPDIFKLTDSSVWRDKLLELGGEYKLWANSPDDPNLN